MTVDELRNMNVKIRGYGMPDDNAPDFYTRCKMSEALEIMENVERDFPKMLSNLCFEITDEKDESLFAIHRAFFDEKDRKYIFLGDNNFNLTKELARKALGVEE